MPPEINGMSTKPVERKLGKSSYSLLLAVFFNYFVGYEFLYIIVIYGFSHSDKLAFALSIVLAFLVNALFLVPLLVSNLKKVKLSKIFKESFKTALIMYVGLFLISFLILLFGGSLDSQNQQIIEDYFALPEYRYAIIFLVLAFAPTVEETVFRYALCAILPPKLRNGLWFILLSSLAFGFVHVVWQWVDTGIFDSFNMLSYSFLGLCLALNYRSNSFNIVYPIAAHLLYNGVQICLMMI